MSNVIADKLHQGYAWSVFKDIDDHCFVAVYSGPAEGEGCIFRPCREFCEDRSQEEVKTATGTDKGVDVSDLKFLDNPEKQLIW